MFPSKLERFLLATMLTVSLMCGLATESSGSNVPQWSRTLGTTNASEYGAAVSADGAGSVYMVGGTEGSLAAPNPGKIQQAFVSKYNEDGNLEWIQQLSDAYGSSNSVSADGLGNVYISGQTQGDLGDSFGGYSRPFVARFDAAGSHLWSRKVGSGVGIADTAAGVAANTQGDVFVVGTTYYAEPQNSANVAVNKYDNAGNLAWTTIIGSIADDRAGGISIDGNGNAYIAGFTLGNLNGTNAGMNDAFVSKIDSGGQLLWTRQFGADKSEGAFDVAVDQFGNVYAAGYTLSNLDGVNAGMSDAFVSKLDSGGNLLWTKQIGSAAEESVVGIAVDSMGSVFVSGTTLGNLAKPNPGNYNTFLSKFDQQGQLLGIIQMGNSLVEINNGLATDHLGNVYLTGTKSGNRQDAYLVKYSNPIPEPCSGALCLPLFAALWRKSRLSMLIAKRCQPLA